MTNFVQIELPYEALLTLEGLKQLNTYKILNNPLNNTIKERLISW